MSQQNKFLELVKDNLQRIGPEIGAMLDHKIERGSTELANALYGGQAFVLYGHGNSHPANVNQLDQAKQPSPEVHEPQVEGHEQSKGRSM